MKDLKELFVSELRDVYDAEKQLIKALPKMVKAAGSEELRHALAEHLEATKGQISRLEQVFQQVGVPSRGKKCDGMAGILEEGKHIMEEDFDESVCDAGLIGAAQKVEHYEIATYGTLRTWAEHLGLNEAAGLLEQIVEEEKEADERLTEIAENLVNAEATAAGSEEEEPRSRRKAA